MINRGEKGKAKITTIGETFADDISELNNSYLGKKILFYNQRGNLGITTIITNIQMI